MSGPRTRAVRRVRPLLVTLGRAPARGLLLVGLLGWATLLWMTAVAAHTVVLPGHSAGAHAGHGPAELPDLTWASVPTQGLSMWVAMVAAMSPLLLLREVSHLSRSSLRRTRVLTLLVFACGYAVPWALAGLVAMPLAAALSGSLLGAVMTAASTLLWMCSPWRRRCLNVCHRAPPLRVFGVAAQADAWRYGAVTGSACAAACAPLMVLVLLATDAHLVAMAGATVLLTVERYLPARRPRWSLPLGPARPEHVALSGGPRLERDLSW